MAEETLIVLFGHENDDEGALSPIATARCDRCLTLLEQFPDAKILPTGAFGAGFNRTHAPHAEYLRRYVVDRGVSAERVLPGTNSSNTVEDALCVRRAAVDGGFQRLVAVTSDFHMARVKFLLGRLLFDRRVEFVEAPTPAGIAVPEKLERQKLRKLHREWSAPFVYRPGADFPQPVYEQAAADQRHYDTISLATVTAMAVVTAYPLLLSVCAEGVTTVGIAQLVAALFNLMLLDIYERTAQAARAARRSLRAIEVLFESRGFSAGYDPASLFAIRSRLKGLPRQFPFSIRFVVLSVGLAATVLLLGSGLTVLSGLVDPNCPRPSGIAGLAGLGGSSEALNPVLWPGCAARAG